MDFHHESDPRSNLDCRASLALELFATLPSEERSVLGAQHKDAGKILPALSWPWQYSMEKDYESFL